MAGYTLTKLSAGAVLPAAWVDSLVQAINWWQGKPLAGDTERPQADLFQTVGQSLANATTTAILFDSEDLDTANGHSTSTNTSRWTCPAGQAGWYDVEGTAAFGNNATGYRLAQLRVNGSTLVASTSTGAVNGNQTSLDVSRKIFMNVGDYVELTGFQNSGGSLTTPVTSGASSTLDVTMCRAQ